MKRRPLLLLGLALTLAGSPSASAAPPSASEELLNLLQGRFGAIAKEYGAEQLGTGEQEREAHVAAVSRRSDWARRSMGPRRIEGPWAAYATSVARRISQANGWPSHPVEIAARLTPYVALVDGRILLTRAMLALTRSEDELAALLVWPLARQHALRIDATRLSVGDRLAFHVWRDDPWLNEPAKFREQAPDWAVHYAARLIWMAEARLDRRSDEAVRGFLEKAGYRGETNDSLERPIARWAEIRQAEGVTRPSFAAPDYEPHPMFETDRLPADPAYLARLAGLPMGAVGDGPLLIGNRLLLPRWDEKLMLPAHYGWGPFGEGALAGEDDRESVMLVPFEAPAKTPIDKAAYFDGWEDAYRPSPYRLKTPEGMSIALAPGFAGQGQTHSLVAGMGSSPDTGEGVRNRYLHLVWWGVVTDAAYRRSDLLGALASLRQPLDAQDRAELAPRALEIVTFTEAEAAAAAGRALSAQERLLTEVLNDLPAGADLPVRQPLKLVRKYSPAEIHLDAPGESP
jgi:hypothetical protein